MIERDAALMSIYKSVKSRVTFNFDEFQRRLTEWDVVPLKQADTIIGGVLIKGNEVHVGYERRPSASILRYIKATLGKILTDFGSAVTTVDAANKNGLRFCLRLGFDVIERKNDKLYLKCLRCKYV
jgi:hypothetical protein